MLVITWFDNRRNCESAADPGWPGSVACYRTLVCVRFHQG